MPARSSMIILMKASGSWKPRALARIPQASIAVQKPSTFSGDAR
jgi:hypothetical protein